jgi:4-aminobutyrate aminotransferase-like enzyme
VLNGITNTALRLAPALTVSEDEIDTAVAMLGAVLSGGAR